MGRRISARFKEHPTGRLKHAMQDRSETMNESLISNIPLFATIPPDELAQMAAELQQITYPAGAILMREGEHGDGVYIVLSGMFEIIKALGTPDEHLFGRRGA